MQGATTEKLVAEETKLGELKEKLKAVMRSAKEAVTRMLDEDAQPYFPPPAITEIGLLRRLLDEWYLEHPYFSMNKFDQYCELLLKYTEKVAPEARRTERREFVNLCKALLMDGADLRKQFKVRH